MIKQNNYTDRKFSECRHIAETKCRWDSLLWSSWIKSRSNQVRFSKNCFLGSPHFLILNGLFCLSVFTLYLVLFCYRIALFSWAIIISKFNRSRTTSVNWPKSGRERLAQTHSIKFYEVSCCFQVYELKLSTSKKSLKVYWRPLKAKSCPLVCNWQTVKTVRTKLSCRELWRKNKTTA